MLNRAIDQLEAFVGAWINTNRIESACIFVLVLIVAWAFSMKAIDHRS